MRERRFLFYSHDGLGLGHTRRNLAIASAVAQIDPEAAVLVATGVEEFARLGLPRNVDVLKLPSLRKLENGRYAARRMTIAQPDILSLRSALLKATVESFRPDVLLADKHPFGAGGELKAALDALRAIGARKVLGLRDILDSTRVVAKEWSDDHQLRVSQVYDRILVYGSKAVFDPMTEYRFPEALAERTRYCGYVVNRVRKTWRAGDVYPGPEREGRVRPVVLATPGGGEDGFVLLETFIRALAGSELEGIIVTGPDTTPEHRTELHRLSAEAGIVFRTFVPYLATWFSKVDALVSMGGYNTLAEALATATPIVCVPRTEPRVEQLLRAEAFGRLGLLRVLHPELLTPESLRSEILEALRLSRAELAGRVASSLRFDGAEEAALELVALADRSEARLAVLAETS